MEPTLARAMRSAPRSWSASALRSSPTGAARRPAQAATSRASIERKINYFDPRRQALRSTAAKLARSTRTARHRRDLAAGSGPARRCDAGLLASRQADLLASRVEAAAIRSWPRMPAARIPPCATRLRLRSVHRAGTRRCRARQAAAAFQGVPPPAMDKVNGGGDRRAPDDDRLPARSARLAAHRSGSRNGPLRYTWPGDNGARLPSVRRAAVAGAGADRRRALHAAGQLLPDATNARARARPPRPPKSLALGAAGRAGPQLGFLTATIEDPGSALEQDRDFSSSTKSLRATLAAARRHQRRIDLVELGKSSVAVRKTKLPRTDPRWWR